LTSTRYNIGDTHPDLRGYAQDETGALTIEEADELELILTSERAVITGEVTVIDPPEDPDGSEGGPFNWRYVIGADDFELAGAYVPSLRIVWDDASDPPRQQTIPNAGLPVVLVGLAAWYPTADEVASTWARARTYSALGGEVAGGSTLGRFTADTTPTNLEAEAIVNDSIRHVLSHFARGEVPQRSYGAAHHAALVYAALEIEISYFPEQAAEHSAFLQLRSLSDAATLALVRHAQVNDLIREDYSLLEQQATLTVGLGGP